MKNKHLKFIIGSVASIISIVFAILLYKSFNDILNLKTLNNLPPKEIEEILSRTIATPLYLFQYIGTTIVLAVTTTTSAWMLSKKAKGLDKAFAITLLFFGGLGIPFILYVVKLIKERKEVMDKPVSKNIIFTRTTGIVATSALVIAPVALVAYSTTMKGVDEPTHASSPVFASDALLNDQRSKTNLIEIFTDGFDERSMIQLLATNKDKITKDNPTGNNNTKNLTGFIGLPNYLTPGFITNDSIPAIFTNNYKDVNPFMAHLEVDENSYHDSVLNYEYKEWFPKFALDKLNGIPYNPKGGATGNIWSGFDTNNMNRHLINPTSMSDSTSYMPHVSGNPKYISKKYDKSDNKVQIVNWGQAKNDVAGNYGVSDLNSDGQFYSWINNNSKSSDEAKPEYLWLQDSLTHTPKNGDKGNKLIWNETYSKYQKVVDNINAIVQHLKDINAYDNTMIVLYGDHSDHSRIPLVDHGKKTYVRGNRSFGLVKYPGAKGSFMMKSDQAYSASEINDIIIDGMQNKGDGSFLDDSRFSINRKFRIYDGLNKTAITHLEKLSSSDYTKGEFRYPYEEIIDDPVGDNQWQRYSELKEKNTIGDKVNWDSFRKDIEGLTI